MSILPLALCSCSWELPAQILTTKNALHQFIHRNVLFQTIDLLNRIGFSIVTIYVFLETFVYIAFYILIPRFVISIRELYDHDIRGRFHIDTGFGVVSRSNAGQDTTASAMVFVDGNQGAEVEGSMDNSGDLGMDRVHGSRLHEDSPLEPGGNRV